MDRNRMQSLAIGLVATLALAAAFYTLQVGRAGSGGAAEGVVTNLQTSNAGTAQSIAHGLVGKPAPTVALQELKGRSVKLEEFRGKRVILSFWTSW